MLALGIHVLHQGRLTRMSQAEDIVRCASTLGGGVRCELIQANGTTAASDRTANSMLLRLQLQGSMRIRGNSGLSTVDHHLAPHRFALFPRGFHLDHVSWEARHSEALFFSIDGAVHSEMLDGLASSVTTPLFGFEDPTFLGLLQLLPSHMMSGEADGPMFGEGISLAICSHLMQCHAKSYPVRSRGESLTEKRLRKVQDYVEENIGTPLTLETLAAQAGLSRYHFVRAFKKASGVTPFEYVSQARIRLATALLRAQTHTIAEIALAAGFSSQSHMTTTFTRFAGVTPGSIRRDSCNRLQQVPLAEGEGSSASGRTGQRIGATGAGET